MIRCNVECWAADEDGAEVWLEREATLESLPRVGDSIDFTDRDLDDGVERWNVFALEVTGVTFNVGPTRSLTVVRCRLIGGVPISESLVALAKSLGFQGPPK